jgi:hypothetical protein
MGQQVADQEPGQVLLRNAPELGDAAGEPRGIREQGVEGGVDPVPAVAGCSVRADQAAAPGLPAEGVVHKLANGPLVAWCRPLPLALGDLAVNLAPLGGGLTPDIQRPTHLVPPT